MYVRLAAVFSAITAALMLVAPSGAHAEETGTIRGTVSRPPDRFFSGRVMLWHAMDVPVMADETSIGFGTGTYEFRNVRPGQYKLEIEVDRVRQWAHQKLTIQDADVFTVAAGEVTVVDETMLPGGVVAISVTDSVTGKPVNNVCANVVTGNPVCGAQNGVLRLTNLPRGNLDIDVFSSDGVHGRVRLEDVRVELGQTTEVAARLPPLGAITTTVLDAQTNQPVSGVCVLVLARHFGALDRNKCHNSGGDGRVLIGELPARTYQLLAIPEQSSHGVQWVGPYGGTGDQRAALDVRTKPGKTTSVGPIKLDPSGTVTGMLRDASTGAPVSDFCPQILPGDIGPRDPFTPCSGADGTYSISGLGPYEWPLQFFGLPSSPYGWQWSGGAGDRYSAQKVQVRAGETATLDTSLFPAAQVTGRMLDADGRPVGGTVEVFNARTGDQAAPRAFVANFDGSYAVGSLTTERVKILYFAFQHPATWYDAAPTFADATPVRARAGHTTEGINLIFP